MEKRMIKKQACTGEYSGPLLEHSDADHLSI